MDEQLAPETPPEDGEKQVQLTEAPVPERSLPVVVMGASAGGLDVFKRLLKDLPGDTGFAIVFIQHLDPSHHSLLAEILSRASTMPVSEAANGMLLEANHVYVMPANVDMTLEGGSLRLAPRTQTPGSHMPIDRFLRSAADQCGRRAIGVILSGTGSDGSAGVEAIKAAGGVTFAQDAATAKFATMPQAAAATGCVDFVLPPGLIAAELIRIARHPYIADRQHPGPKGTQAADAERFAKIVHVLHGATGIDFSLYREKMVKRRILRRLALRNVSLADYSDRLENDSAELGALHRDLLISVTSFFRERQSFECLKKAVYPRLMQARLPTETIRVWVAGCATGEEAFSIAISLQEYMNETGVVFPVQIFASDISSRAIEKARTGRYLENIAADITHERLNRFFTKIEGGYQINKNLREMCVFARHNLIEDPPFSKLDLISCRNVLIYLGSVQKDIIPVFHYALKPTGFLMLGGSEAAAPSDLFSVADREHRVYSKRETASKRQYSQPGGKGPNRATGDRTTAEMWDSDDGRREVDRILLSRYSPVGVVVNDELEVMEIRGKHRPYLDLPLGKVSFNLVRLIPDTGLFFEVEKLVQQVRKSGDPARQEHVPYDYDGTTGALNLEAVPIDSSKGRSVLVLFEPVPDGSLPLPVSPDTAPGDNIKDREIRSLKQQLAYSKQRFLSAIEAHQASRQENQNTTEEALSANEELQSLNEELETAKEELQSANEELITVNDELVSKNSALGHARDFALGIVETVRQPLLVLDMNLRIRMANRAFYRTFQVSQIETEGQDIFSLSRGSWDLAALREALAALLKDANSFPDFEVEQEFPVVGHRSLVVGGCRVNHLKMILLAVDDITDRKLAQRALRKSEEHLRQTQKMEAVGRLAGGIAHDFNNLLTAIIGYSSLLRGELAGNDAALHQVSEIQSAGEKAAALTHQLLAFSRRQVLQPKVLDLNAVVADFERMLRRLVDERIHLVIKCDPEVWQVRADPGEISRAIMNLALNARDAMPAGGTMTIETANITVAGPDASGLELAPGRYVMLAVHDTGVGMDPEVRAHIFEPFFTTKEVGRGTGLGLATVLGIVEQSGGVIRCQSHIGEGTVFKIVLPAVAEEASPPRPVSKFSEAPKGTEVVLLVEDEGSVRKLATMILQASGYTVLDASNGRHGLEVCAAHQGPIDLLVTDVMMPELGGRELAERILERWPNTGVLFMSGHTEDVLLKEGIQKGMPFLQKPFTAAGLARAVRDILDSKRRT